MLRFDPLGFNEQDLAKALKHRADTIAAEEHSTKGDTGDLMKRAIRLWIAAEFASLANYLLQEKKTETIPCCGPEGCTDV